MARKLLDGSRANLSRIPGQDRPISSSASPPATGAEPPGGRNIMPIELTMYKKLSAEEIDALAKAMSTYVLPRGRPQNSPVGRALLKLLMSCGAWYGTASELINDLQQYAEPEALLELPQTPRASAGQLQRLRRGLEAEGFEVWCGRHGKRRDRCWAIWPLDPDHCWTPDEIRRTVARSVLDGGASLHPD